MHAFSNRPNALINDSYIEDDNTVLLDPDEPDFLEKWRDLGPHVRSFRLDLDHGFYCFRYSVWVAERGRLKQVVWDGHRYRDPASLYVRHLRLVK